MFVFVYLSFGFSFADLSRNSGPPWNMKVNMTEELAAISARVNAATYLCDYDFQLDVSKLFIRFNDAHTHCNLELTHRKNFQLI